MVDFKPAWDKQTGEKLPHLVPETHFTHPYFRDAITNKPPTRGGAASAAKTEKEG